MKIKNVLNYPFMPWFGNDPSGPTTLENAPAETSNTPVASLPTDPTELSAVPAAHACIDILANTIARLPKTVVNVENYADDVYEINEDHMVSRRLRRPSDTIDANLFWRWFFASLFSRGNAYSYIDRPTTGSTIHQLIPVESVQVKEAVDTRATIQRQGFVYDVRLAGGQDLPGVSPKNILAVHGPGYNPTLGYSPSPVLSYAKNTLQKMKLANRRQRKALNSPFVNIAAQISEEGDQLSNEQKLANSELLHKAISQSKNGIVETPFGYTLDDIQTLSQRDIDIIQIMEFDVLDICRIWNVPPRKVFMYEQGIKVPTFSEQTTDFVRWTVAPLVESIESQLTMKLLSGREEVRFPLSNLSRGTMRDEVETLMMATTRAPLMTPNEARPLMRMGLGDSDDPMADRLMVPTGSGGPSDAQQTSE